MYIYVCICYQNKILKLKINNINDLKLVSKMRLEFTIILTYLKSLSFSSEPNYDYLLLLLRKIFYRMKASENSLFDWEEMKNEDNDIYCNDSNKKLIPEKNKYSNSFPCVNNNDASHDSKNNKTISRRK
jgi:hypothetical protein